MPTFGVAYCAPRVMKQDGETQSDEPCTKARIGEDRRDFGESAPAAQHEEREIPLFAGGKSRHVGILQDVRAMLVISRVRN